MAPPVRFLEQLMPAARQGGASVRAALPSRFAPQTFEVESRESLALDASDADGASRDETHVDPFSSQKSQHYDEPTTSTTPLTPARAPLGDSPVIHDVQIHVKADAPSPRGEAIAPTAPASARVPARASSQAPLPVPERHTNADHSAVAQERPHAIARETQAAMRATRVSNPAPTNAIGRPPLREHVREQRVGARPVEPPTIVQVTIDRIDVRAPAAAAAPERPASKPRSASSKSLGDYLRERERANGGAS